VLSEVDQDPQQEEKAMALRNNPQTPEFPDDWIENIIPEADLPRLPNGSVVLFGYWGDEDPLPRDGKGGLNTTARKRYRLYLTLALNEYVVVQHDDILYAKNIPEGFYTPVGGTLLWIRPDAELKYVHVRVDTAQIQASFLQGPIAGGGSGSGNSMARGGGLGSGGLTATCGGGGLTATCGGGGLTATCGGGGLTATCGGGGLTATCGGGGLTATCGGGGLTVGCL
jgi:hypothetical protein